MEATAGDKTMLVLKFAGVGLVCLFACLPENIRDAYAYSLPDVSLRSFSTDILQY